MHDTLKKPKDILTASYAVRFPEKALKSKTLVREVDVDPQVRREASLHSRKFNEPARSDPRIRQTEVARHRKVDSGDNMLQLHVENAFPVRHKVWEIFQWFVSRLPALRSLPSYPLSLSVSKLLTKFAWRLTVDAYRTHIPLIYPPHTVALGCLYLSALLLSFEQTPPPPSQTFQQQAMTPPQLISLLTQGGEWEDQFNIDADHLERKLAVPYLLANRTR